MKYLIILALSVLFTSFGNEGFAQQAVFNAGVYGKEHMVIGQNISDYSALVTVGEGTEDFLRGNLVLVSYKSYINSVEQHTMLFVCSKTTTTLRLRSVGEKAPLPLHRLDAIKTVRLSPHNLGDDQRRALEESCD